MSDGEPTEMDHSNQNTGPRKLVETRVRGTVKWFNVKSGYGFIHREDDDSDIFVHQSAISQPDPDSNSHSLNDGEEVEFYVVEGEKGDEAYEVTGPNGAPVKGSKFASFNRGRGGGYAMRGRGRGMAPMPFSNSNEFYYGRGRGRGFSPTYGGGGGGGYDYMDRGGRGRPFYGSGRPPRSRGFRNQNYEYDSRGGSRGSYRGRRSDEYGSRNGDADHGHPDHGE